VEFYSVIKKNEILLFSGKCMELENIMLSEVSQCQKEKHHVFSHKRKRRAKYKYKHYYMYIGIYRMFPKVEVLEETKRGGKEEKNDRVNNTEIHDVCRDEVRLNALETVEQYKVGEKAKEE
jgi:hypothetical protein